MDAAKYWACRSGPRRRWTAFLRQLARRGLRGVKLVISDAHEGIKTAISKVLHATWQRCVVAAFVGTAFVQEDAEAASKQ